MYGQVSHSYAQSWSVSSAKILVKSSQNLDLEYGSCFIHAPAKLKLNCRGKTFSISYIKMCCPWTIKGGAEGKSRRTVRGRRMHSSRQKSALDHEGGQSKAFRDIRGKI